MISFKKEKRAEILATLFNNARTQGLGWLHYDKQHLMTTEEADNLLKETDYFDYLEGRVMKVKIKEDSFEERLYDRDNGQGAAYEAVKHLL